MPPKAAAPSRGPNTNTTGTTTNTAGAKSKTGDSSASKTGAARQGKGPGDAGGWPSTTAKPSGGGRSNAK